MTSYLFYILLLIQESPTLIIQVKGVESVRGQLMVAVYSDPESFMDENKMYRAEVVKVSNSSPTLSINIPEGTYAVSLFHDLNSDTELNTNFVGIPREPYGFSNNPNSTFGPPSFKESSFEIRKDKVISIQLR